MQSAINTTWQIWNISLDYLKAYHMKQLNQIKNMTEFEEKLEKIGNKSDNYLDKLLVELKEKIPVPKTNDTMNLAQYHRQIKDIAEEIVLAKKAHIPHLDILIK